MYLERKIDARMRERKRMSVNLAIKSLDAQGRFAGYASVFDLVDNQRDIVMKGAFSNTLGPRTRDIKLLWQHQQDEPIGVFDQMFEDQHGLYVEGRLLLDVQRAKEALSLLKAGAINGLSIGYSPVRYQIDADTGIRKLSEVDLFEVSLVTFPANQAAGVTVLKHDAPPVETKEWKQAAGNGQVIELADALDRAFAALLQ